MLAEPSATTSACATACESGVAALSASDANLVDACFHCLGAAGNQCYASLQTQCQPVCDSGPISGASDNYGAALQALLKKGIPPALLCKNGMILFGIVGGGTCAVQPSTTGDCTDSCFNLGSSAGATPDVAVQCSATLCTCTAGKNKGKTFPPPASPVACGNLDPWDECNL
jgi:hypothetical protein